MESSRDMNTVGGTGTSRNCSAMRAKVANEPAICVSAPRCYNQRMERRMEPPLRSGFVGRPPATLEKRSPINRSARCLCPCISAVRRRVFRIGEECWCEVKEAGQRHGKRHQSAYSVTRAKTDFRCDSIRPMSALASLTLASVERSNGIVFNDAIFARPALQKVDASSFLLTIALSVAI